MTVDNYPPILRPGADIGVLDITKFFGDTTGGIRTYLLEKAAYVKAREALRQSIVIPAEASNLSDDLGVRWYRIKSPRIPTQDPYRFLLAGPTIGRIIAHERPSLIEVGSPYLVPWITRRAARPFGIPLVLFYHTNFPRIISPRPDRDVGLRRFAGRAADHYLRRLGRAVDAAIGASAAAVRELSQAGFHRVEQVGLGVELELFHPRRRARSEETRQERGIPAAPVALYAGRLAREKELHLVIDAWPQVERATGAHLVIVGGGPSEQFFRRRSVAKRVTWLPFENDRTRLADLFACADLYIAPGPAETFGLAALEAMASGTPVVSSDRGAVREIVEASGAGIVNPEPTAQSMAMSITSLLRQDLTALGARGRAYAEAHHSWSTVFDRLFAFYRRLLAEGNG